MSLDQQSRNKDTMSATEINGTGRSVSANLAVLK